MKNMSKLLVVTLIISMLIPIISYAISETNNKENKEFFVSNKNQAYRGEEIELSIDLSLIKFDNFEFILTSNMNLDGITIQDEIETDKDKNQLSIISNKKEMSLDKISLFYKIPEDIEIGSKVNLTGLVKEYKYEEVDNNTDNDKVQDDNTVQEEQKVTITIIVIEKQNEEENKEDNKQEESDDKESQVQNQNTVQMQKTTTTNSMQIQETNTYNGESNNYLSKLSINGYDLTPIFSKTTNTYFVNVKENVSKITVNATAEDENATVNVYGNTDLKEGENKVLISVTAENGEVKVYRVYVIK